MSEPPSRCQWHLERIHAHILLGGLDGFRVPFREHQRLSEVPIREVGIERNRPLELRDRRRMLALASKNTRKLGTCLR